MIGDHTEDDDDGKRKEHEIDKCTHARDLRFFFTDLQRFLFHKNETASGDHSNRNGKRQSHNAHKFARGDIECGIYVKILRISEGGEHTAEVCGDILHDEGECHVFFLTRGRKNEISKRQEREKRHIIGKKHGTDEGDIHQGQNTKTGIFANADDLVCQRHEEADVS